MNEKAPRDYRTELSRRRLLSGLGSLTVALTSPVWRPATAFGADNAALPGGQRFMVMFSANGTVPTSFFPTAPVGAAETPLTTMSPILTPLDPYKAKLVVMKGVHMSSANVPQPGGPHMKGPGAMLTGGKLNSGNFQGAGGPAGYADRISVDQTIADKIGTGTTFKSLEFGVRTIGGPPLNVIAYRGSNQPLTPVNDPWQMHSRIFANANLSPTDLAKIVAERKSVLDFLKDDVTRLRMRVSSEDKARLDAHLGSIAGIEQQLSKATVSCTPMMMPVKSDPQALGAFATISQLQLDLMLLAHQCGLTKVSTFMWANADSWQFFPFAGVNEEHHTLSHEPDSNKVAGDKLVKIATWHAQQVAYVLSKLDAVPEVGGGTMLDSTVLLWGNELGKGDNHTYKDIPWVVAGGGGHFNTGRYLQYKDQSHNNLLVSLCHAMGMSDVTTFGIPELCTGPLSGLAA